MISENLSCPADFVTLPLSHVTLLESSLRTTIAATPKVFAHARTEAL
jgi:hypothetical protein